MTVTRYLGITIMENSWRGQADRPVVCGPTNRVVSPTGMKI